MFGEALYQAGCVKLCLLDLRFDFSDKTGAYFPFEVRQGSLREGCEGFWGDGCFAPDSFAHDTGFSKWGCVGVRVTSDAGIFKYICVGVRITSNIDILKCICFFGLVSVCITVSKCLHQCLVLSRSLHESADKAEG